MAKKLGWGEWIEKHRVRITPVMDKGGILFWSAGYVTLAGDKWRNVVIEGNYVHAPTFLEALTQLRETIRPPRRKRS